MNYLHYFPHITDFLYLLITRLAMHLSIIYPYFAQIKKENEAGQTTNQNLPKLKVSVKFGVCKCFPYFNFLLAPTTRVTRRSATPVPSLLTDPAYASSPGVQRELARLRIDACLGKILPGLDDISLNLPRVTRRLRKREQKTPETITSPENNNTQVVESSQDTIVHIKPLGESETQSKPKEKVDETENCNSSEKINVDLDRPVVPELTPTLLEGAEKETESIEPDDSLPGSPITVETPTRTSELRSNTSQISPIRSKTTPLVQKTLEEYMETPRTTPKTVLNCGNRSKKLVDLANNQQQVEEERIVATPVGKQESDKEAFLTFSRELPSSSAVPPGGSILKRKNPDFTDDSSSPCVKVCIEIKFLSTLLGL